MTRDAGSGDRGRRRCRRRRRGHRSGVAARVEEQSRRERSERALSRSGRKRARAETDQGTLQSRQVRVFPGDPALRLFQRCRVGFGDFQVYGCVTFVTNGSLGVGSAVISLAWRHSIRRWLGSWGGPRWVRPLRPDPLRADPPGVPFGAQPRDQGAGCSALRPAMEHPDPGASRDRPSAPRNHHAKRSSVAPACSGAVQTYRATQTENPLRTAPRGKAERLPLFAAVRAPMPVCRPAAAPGQCPWRRPHGDKVRVVRQHRPPRGGRNRVQLPARVGGLRNPPGSGRRLARLWRNPGGPVLPVGARPAIHPA